jgi:molybdenum cofactor biosynthesis enzyme MoaA
MGDYMRRYDIRMPLYEIRLSVDGRCNYNCIYCGPFADGKKALGYGSLTLEQVENIGKLISKYNLHVQITGGEPSIRDDLDKIILILSKNNVEDIGLSTNGSRISKEYMSRMIRNGLKEVHFHVPSLDQDVYEKTVRNSKKVKEVIDLSLYSKERIIVEYNTPVTRINIKTLRNLLDFCLENSINIKLIEEVSLSKDRIKEKEIEKFLEDWLNERNVKFRKTLRPKKYGYIYETDRDVRFRIAPVTPNLIEHIQGEPQDILLDGRFWIGGQNGKYVYTPSYFITPEIGTLKDLEETLEKTIKLYEGWMRSKNAIITG